MTHTRDALALGPPPVVTPDDAARRGRHLLEKLLGHRRPGESVKGAIVRAATLAGLDAERVREIWYQRAKLLACELMQMEARVSRREAQLARLLDRLAGLTDAPGLPPHLSVADAIDLAERVPEAESWARGLSAAARALILACVMSVLIPIILDASADARPVRRGGPAAEKVMDDAPGKVGAGKAPGKAGGKALDKSPGKIGGKAGKSLDKARTKAGGRLAPKIAPKITRTTRAAA